MPATNRSAPKSKKSTRTTDSASSAPEGESEIMDMDQAIALLKTTRPTFYRWLKSGKLKGMKAGRQWRFYKQDVERFMRGEGPRAEADAEPLVQQLRAYAKKIDGVKKPEATGDVAEAVNWTILLAVALRASDIHVDASVRAGSTEPVATLRYRVDGELQTAAEFDLRLMRAVVERWKHLANCDLNVRNRPQDGRVEMKAAGRTLDLRVTFLPAAFGECFTARILDASHALIDLAGCNFAPADLERVEKALAQSWGLVLCTGPTGSGKTTVLYSCLGRVTTSKQKVISIESPVEILLPGVVQLPVHPQYSICAMARAALRGAPNVLMIGELADEEISQIAVDAALTGHLVLSQMHTDEAAGALVRLCDLGLVPFMVAEAVKVVVGQRLVRRLCPHCRKAGKPEAHFARRAEHLAREGGLDEVSWKDYALPRGCRQCHDTGFRGRRMIAEVLVMNGKLQSALMNREGVESLRRIAVAGGMTTFLADGVRRAMAGETTIEEVLRYAPQV